MSQPETPPADRPAHPYIPNSDPTVRRAMLAAIGLRDVVELYADVPDSLRLTHSLDLPPPLHSEAELKRHLDTLLARNISTRDALSFLGAGCYDHYVPAVCDEINGRAEFLTAYAGTPHEDHGRFQALFEYASMMGELLDMDVVTVPLYDGYQAAATALRMAGRLTGRPRALVSAAMAADQISRLADYLNPVMQLQTIPVAAEHGSLDADALTRALGPDVAAVLIQTPNYFGIVEPDASLIGELAHRHGALFAVSCDPISLGVLAPPAQLGADIVCGDLQSLGMHQQFGGGQAGFIATHDDPRVINELPTRLFGIAHTAVPGEYGFGDIAIHRTSFARRKDSREWVGTAAALWGITAGVYLALMGPHGMADLGHTVLANTAYAMHRLATIPGVQIRHAPAVHFREFVVDLAGTRRSVADIDAALRARGIFPGLDISGRHAGLGPAMLTCVTERHTKADIDRLAQELENIL